MPDTTDTRLHPIAALRAIRNLLHKQGDTRQVFLVIDALRGKTTVRQLARFRRSEFGRAALADHRCLLDRLKDRQSLAALPAGTLGRAYYDFMSTENLTADMLIEASQLRSDPAAIDDTVWFRERNREMHDLLHVVTGYGRDPLGEACLLGFSYAQTGQKGFAAIALFAARRISQARPGYPIRRAIFEGYRRGRSAGWLIAADWETLLTEPVAAIREKFRVGPARTYPQIIAALRRAGDSAVGAAPAAAAMMG